MNPTINQQATGLQVFYNSETGVNLRTQVVNNESWFVAQDICNILGLNNITKAMAALDFDEKHGVTISNAVGNNQEVRAVNESGLYHLIFISRKPEAKAFRKWVTNVVLPSIRRTGSYSSNGIQTPLEEPLKKLLLPKHRPFFENWQGCVSPHLSEREGHIVASNLGVSYSHGAQGVSGYECQRTCGAGIDAGGDGEQAQGRAVREVEACLRAAESGVG